MIELTGGLTPQRSSPSLERTRRSSSRPKLARRWPRAPRSSSGWPPRRARLWRLDRVRLARDHPDPRGAPRGAAAGPDPLARRRHGRAGRARGGPGDDAAARTVAGHGVLGGAGRRSPRRSCELLNAGITPIVPEHGSLGASGDLAPLAHCAPGADRRGRGHGRQRAPAPGGPRRSPRPGSSR